MKCILILVALFIQGCSDPILYALGAHEPSHKREELIANLLSNDKNVANYCRDNSLIIYPRKTDEILSAETKIQVGFYVTCDEVLNTVRIGLNLASLNDANKILKNPQCVELFKESVVKAVRNSGFKGRITEFAVAYYTYDNRNVLLKNYRVK